MTDPSLSSSKAPQPQPQLPPQQQPQQQRGGGGRSQGGRNHNKRSEQNRNGGRGGVHEGYVPNSLGGGGSKSLLQPPTMMPMDFSLSPTAAAVSPGSPTGSMSEPQPQPMVMQQYGSKAPKPRVPMWLTKVRTMLPVSLHQEIKLFYEQMKAAPEEEKMRKDLVSRLTALITKLWPSAKVTLYGSCLTETCLPMSDVDIVVTVDTPYPPLQVLADALRRNFKFDLMELLTTARVPLIKLCDSQTKLVVDISFNQSNGPRNSEAVLELMRKYPETKPLVFVLKYFLYWHSLNEVYSGGLGSYALTLMIVSYIQKHGDLEKRVPGGADGAESERDLGHLLLGFLRFYGFEFDYENKGISVLGEGSYFSKIERGWFYEDKPYLLALEDPCELENDVGKSAFNITTVTMLFRQAYDQLMIPERYPHVSFLIRVMDVPAQIQTVRRHVSAPFRAKKSGKKSKKRQAAAASAAASTTTTPSGTETKNDSTKTTIPSTTASTTTNVIDAAGAGGVGGNDDNDDDVSSDATTSTSTSLRSSKESVYSGSDCERSDESGVVSDSTPKLEGDTSSSSTNNVTEERTLT